MSDAVKVRPPAVLSVTLNVLAPATSAALAGRTALLSLEVMPVTSLVTIKFQLASTAFTVTANAAPAVCATGAPLLPEAVPGLAVSPGTSSWSFARAPALTLIEGLVLAVLDASDTSDAVRVLVPAVLSVTLRLVVARLRDGRDTSEGSDAL